MRLAIFRATMKIAAFFKSFTACQKEMGGYTCRHGIHIGQHGGFVRECDGTPVNRDGTALA